jgi:hypothetical protein
MSEQNSKGPSAGELDYPMKSEYAKHANSPAATGGDPQVQGAPGTSGGDVSPSEEAKNQWAGAKGPAQSGKP